jgi:hypothetical protein
MNMLQEPAYLSQASVLAWAYNTASRPDFNPLNRSGVVSIKPRLDPSTNPARKVAGGGEVWSAIMETVKQGQPFTINTVLASYPSLNRDSVKSALTKKSKAGLLKVAVQGDCKNATVYKLP